MFNITNRPSGTTFNIENANIQCSPRPKVGDLVTLEYDNFTQKEVPVNAIITRIRKDTTWREVVADYVANKSQAKTLNGMVSFLFVICVVNYYHAEASKGALIKHNSKWTEEYKKSTREFLEAFARQRQLDPLVPDTWYHIGSKYFSGKVNILFCWIFLLHLMQFFLIREPMHLLHWKEDMWKPFWSFSLILDLMRQNLILYPVCKL